MVVRTAEKLRVNPVAGIRSLPGDGVSSVDIRSAAAKRKVFFSERKL